jgi:hypothetical protein
MSIRGSFHERKQINEEQIVRILEEFEQGKSVEELCWEYNNLKDLLGKGWRALKSRGMRSGTWWLRRTIHSGMPSFGGDQPLECPLCL